MSAPGAAARGADPTSILRSPEYARILLVAAALGIPVALLAFWFLQLSVHLQQWVYDDLPGALGLGDPAWWPVPVLVVGGLLVALTIRYLPGRGGEVPADGFRAGGGFAPPAHLAGIALAALVTLGCGAVLGPEAPLIALGGGLGAWAIRAVRHDAPEQAVALIGAAGSFAAISTLLGSPLPAAFLLMEIAGIGGAMTSLLLAPGLLAAGVGALIFVGLDSLTGLGTASLSLPDLPEAGSPTVAEFGWALVIGVLAAYLGTWVRRLAQALVPLVERRLLVAVPAVGLGIALLAVLYAEVTGKEVTDVLFSGQDALGGLITSSADYSVGALVLLLLCKGLAYVGSLAAFRGGPIFPAMFLGAAGGMALSHLPGLDTMPAVAMGIGAMCVAMLGFPLVSVLLATLLLQTDGLQVMPLVIVAVVVAYVVRARLVPVADQRAQPQPVAGSSGGGTPTAGSPSRTPAPSEERP